MAKSYYSAPLSEFILAKVDEISGQLNGHHTQDRVFAQQLAWQTQTELLQPCLKSLTDDPHCHIFYELMIPRMGRRADVVLIYKGIVFVVEFKVGESHFNHADMRQAHGYALDLKNFHKGSHHVPIVPLLVCTKADYTAQTLVWAADEVAEPICCNTAALVSIIRDIAGARQAKEIDVMQWQASGYLPTPTIIEAAQALYAEHHVEDIARSEADSQNIGQTSQQLLALINDARVNKKKVICFVTGVPGAGKTLIGLNIASAHANPQEHEYSVFLSGNGPLVAVLQEALAKDRAVRKQEPIGKARKQTESFIQNIHKFRDEYLLAGIPPEKVAIFDEAQRAWDKDQASSFMRQKRGMPDFNQSEPEFLIDVMDRHDDWAFIIALIGGGQEINKGEAGLAGWLAALKQQFLAWDVYFSSALTTGEYVSQGVDLSQVSRAKILPSLHLATSMRSFRAEKLSSFIHYLIAGKSHQAQQLYSELAQVYPIRLTRDLATAKAWVTQQRRANESMGLLASSNGIRLKAEGIFVKNTIDPAQWFLSGDGDIRAAEFLEDVATEFDVQGLELDWCLVAWDADYRVQNGRFEHWQFKGTKWQRRGQEASQKYLENAYRVLLTRARQGMVLYIPKGDNKDLTRQSAYYDDTYAYLRDCGIPLLD